MAESDEKKVNYLLFYEVINRLKGLKDQIDEQKRSFLQLIKYLQTKKNGRVYQEIIIMK